jgi:hypothetical protein
MSIVLTSEKEQLRRQRMSETPKGQPHPHISGKKGTHLYSGTICCRRCASEFEASLSYGLRIKSFCPSCNEELNRIHRQRANEKRCQYERRSYTRLHGDEEAKKILSFQENVLRKLRVLCHYSEKEFNYEYCDGRILKTINYETPCCKECGYDDVRALSIDHVNEGGTVHRKEVGGIYSYLIKNNLPEGYQVLCMNCQWIKRVTNHELNKVLSR